MKINILGKKGQNTAEYAILIALVIAVAVAMQTYVKRGMQGGVKFAVDKVKKGDSGTGQYEPYYLQSSFETKQSAYKDTIETQEGGKVIRKTEAGDDTAHKTTRTGEQKYTDTSLQD